MKSLIAILRLPEYIERMARPTNNEILFRSIINLVADAVAERIGAAPTVTAGKRKRNLSAAGRARISAAAKKRWAHHRKANPERA